MVIVATGLCLSAKPHPSQAERPSASRELLGLVASRLVHGVDQYMQFDVRERPLPAWAGVTPSELENHNYSELARVVDSADLVVVAAPAYFCGLSGVAKNALDLIGHDPAATAPLVAGLVVGERPGDAERGAAQLTEAVTVFAGELLTPVWAVAEPQQTEPRTLAARALAFGQLCQRELSRSLAQATNR